MAKKFSQNFIVYHGCGLWYHDGTNRIVAKKRACINPTYNHFGKKQMMFVTSLKQEHNSN